MLGLSYKSAAAPPRKEAPPKRQSQPSKPAGLILPGWKPRHPLPGYKKRKSWTKATPIFRWIRRPPPSDKPKAENIFPVPLKPATSAGQLSPRQQHYAKRPDKQYCQYYVRQFPKIGQWEFRP